MRGVLDTFASRLVPPILAGTTSVIATVTDNLAVEDVSLLAALVAVVYLLIRVIEGLSQTALKALSRRNGTASTDPRQVLIEIRDLLKLQQQQMRDLHGWMNAAEPYSLGREIVTFHKRMSEAIDTMTRLHEQTAMILQQLQVDVRTTAAQRCPIQSDERLREILKGR